jgi:hypothetical protein
MPSPDVCGLQSTQRFRPVPLASGPPPRCRDDPPRDAIVHPRICFVENFSLTPGFSRVRKVSQGKNRLNGFFWGARSWFTALKRGVNEMISTEHHELKNLPPLDLRQLFDF